MAINHKHASGYLLLGMIEQPDPAELASTGYAQAYGKPVTVTRGIPAFMRRNEGDRLPACVTCEPGPDGTMRRTYRHHSNTTVVTFKRRPCKPVDPEALRHMTAMLEGVVAFPNMWRISLGARKRAAQRRGTLHLGV